jgi:hypothetical protein
MDESSLRLAEVFERELRGRAEVHGWDLASNPRLLRDGSSEGIEALLAALPNVPTEVRSSDSLPKFRRAFDLRPVSLSLLLCLLDPLDPEDSYRAALWWAGLVRSEIAPARRSDLHLFLIAPTSSSDQPIWRERRSRIESDERFCRKFVWLPTEKPDEVEIREFLDRTFLAQPWKGRSAEPRSLDPLEQLIYDASGDSLLTSDEVRRWIARLASIDMTPTTQIAEDLVGLLEVLP